MSNTPKIGQSLRNWAPSQGGGKSDNSKLFSTEAKDAKDTMNGTNELKEHLAPGGKPKGPFGPRGREF